MRYLNGFISNDNVFSGWVMLSLEPIGYDWFEHIKKVVEDNKTTIAAPEFQCHVSVLGGIHRDDLIRLKSSKEFLLFNKATVTAESNVSYFDNHTTVAKYAIKNTEDMLRLREIRNELFCKVRSLEHYPNYQPHITLGYFQPGTRIVADIYGKNQFKVVGFRFSYIDETGKDITWMQ